MILDAIGSLIGRMAGTLLGFIFSLFGDIDLSGMREAISGIVKYIKAACYFLPMDTISAIFSIIMTIWTARLCIRTLKVIWEIIPIL